MGENKLLAKAPAGGNLVPGAIHAIQLRPDVAVLLRPPGNRIQLGIDPATSVVFELPVTSAAVARAIWAAFKANAEQSTTHSPSELCLHTQLCAAGLEETYVSQLTCELHQLGFLEQPLRHNHITVIGRDQLRFRLYDLLRSRNTNIQARGLSQQLPTWLSNTPVHHIGTAVITGCEVISPDLAAILWSRRIPHLFANIRDNIGIIGPLVTPPVAPCSFCLECHRMEEDSARENLALQLQNRILPARKEVILATATVLAAQLLPGLITPTEGNRVPGFGFQGCFTTVDLAALSVTQQPLIPHPTCPVCADTIANTSSP